LKKFSWATIIGVFLFNFSVWADGDVFSHPLKPETTGAFDAAFVRLSEHPIVRGNFEQEKILSRLNRSLKSSGNFIIAAGQGMVWDTLNPFPSTLALGKDYLVQSRPGGQKTVLSARGNETFIRMAEVISAVFSGRSRELQDNFEVYYSGSSSGWELGLLPKEKAISSFAVRITMKGDEAIRSILINEQNGDAVVYALYNHSYPSELASHEKSFFTAP
jgi:hypothetical protein